MLHAGGQGHAGGAFDDFVVFIHRPANGFGDLFLSLSVLGEDLRSEINVEAKVRLMPDGSVKDQED